MINLDSLVSVVHLSVANANQKLQDQNQELFQRFFDQIPNEESNLQGSGQPNSDQNDNRTLYRPKYVTIEYPFETSDGIKTMGVDVPLLTIVPVTAPRISEVRFKTELEVGVKEDNSLEIAFPSTKKGGLFNADKSSPSLAELEIVIHADDPPEGLKKLIEGYDRALRAQIPG
ncbi:DUF2589 domain-containing protein [Enterovibrio norvegicus]|uniref:DUF2589 domain-containing protein n=1 Tax=Enterovibrio norvegicus TaxID=188144 RepID=UPI003550678E